MSEAAITLIVAFVSTIIGVGTFFHFFLTVLRWPHATGVVTGNVAKNVGDRGCKFAYFPLIRFQASNGETYEVRGDIGRTNKWPLGKAIGLQYRAANPKHATTMNAWQRLMFSAVFMGMAAACWYAWLGMAPD